MAFKNNFVNIDNFIKLIGTRDFTFLVLEINTIQKSASNVIEVVKDIKLKFI